MCGVRGDFYVLRFIFSFSLSRPMVRFTVSKTLLFGLAIYIRKLYKKSTLNYEKNVDFSPPVSAHHAYKQISSLPICGTKCIILHSVRLFFSSTFFTRFRFGLDCNDETIADF